MLARGILATEVTIASDNDLVGGKLLLAEHVGLLTLRGGRLAQDVGKLLGVGGELQRAEALVVRAASNCLDLALLDVDVDAAADVTARRVPDPLPRLTVQLLRNVAL